MKFNYPVQLALAFVCAGSFAQGAVHFDLSTAVVSGGGQNLHAASITNAGGQSGSFAGSSLPGSLKFANGSTAAGTGDYFIGTFTTHSLTNVGDSITLSFNVTTSNIGGNAQQFRFGLFDVGTATTGSGTPASNSFASARGYRADYGPTNTNNGIHERTGTDNFTSQNLFSTAASPALGSNVGFVWNPATNQTLTNTGSLSITLIAGNQMEVVSQFAGLTAVSAVDASSLSNTFNAFAFFAANGGNRFTMDFSALTVSSVAAIPEPAGASALMGGLAASMILASRRRRRVS